MIAAAPELLEALQLAALELDARREIIGFPNAQNDAPLAKIRAAIAKVTGRA